MTISLKTTTFANLRVAGQLNFIPAHINAGKRISSRAIITAYFNNNRGGADANGKTGTHESYKFVAWGKLAEICCKVMSKGSSFSTICEPNSYSGTVYLADGSMKLDSAGQPVMTNKVTFTIMSISFGEESAAVIDAEIANGVRPVNWNRTGHPDVNVWKSVLKQKHNTPWNFQNKTYFNARVSVPTAPGVTLDFERLNLSCKGTAPVTAPMPNMVAYASNQPAQQYQAPVQQYQPQQPQYQPYQAPVQPPVYNQAPVAPPQYQAPVAPPAQYQAPVNQGQFSTNVF
jgi:hypothetical protein